MHTPATEARLKANSKAYATFQKYKAFYFGIAKDVRDTFGRRYPALSQESHVFMVKRTIMDIDPNIYAMAVVGMAAEDVADCIARMVVGHDN